MNKKTYEQKTYEETLSFFSDAKLGVFSLGNKKSGRFFIILLRQVPDIATKVCRSTKCVARQMRNIEISKCRNVEMSKYRNVEIRIILSPLRDNCSRHRR